MEKKRPTAIITGASRGIGRAIAREMAESTYNVVAVSRNIQDADLEDVREICNRNETGYLAHSMDVKNLNKHQSLIDTVDRKFGGIDLLVNNAGVAPLVRSDLLEMTPESFDRLMQINLRGPLFLSQSVAKYIQKQSVENQTLKRFVFITSISAEVSSVNRGEYCISKAGLSMCAKLFAHRFMDENIQVFEIRPGIIQTDMTSGVKEKYDQLISEGLVPQKRWGKPEDISRIVKSIVSGDFNYASGSVFEVSGGMNIRTL